MPKKVIQVPIEEDLLRELDNLSKKHRRARADVIRGACLEYLRRIQDEELDRQYQQGYIRIPESADIGEAQIAMTGELLPSEDW